MEGKNSLRKTLLSLLMALLCTILGGLVRAMLCHIFAYETLNVDKIYVAIRNQS